jgi:AbrB family looped-hinge helix DNA binding protein
MVISLETITLSKKFQVVIPKKAREHLELKPGQKLVVIEKGTSLEFVKIGKIKDARGLVKGLSSGKLRDHSERFD